MIRVGILTISDSAVAGTRNDQSGPALAQRCQELNWPVVDMKTVRDEQRDIAAVLTEWSAIDRASLILTTGGTGVSHRDVTPEATRNVIEREIPGIGELMRAKGLEQTKYSVLSRGLAGTRNKTVIVNLPGSPRGAVTSFKAIEHLVPHIVDLLSGRTEHTEQSNNGLAQPETAVDRHTS